MSDPLGSDELARRVEAWLERRFVAVTTASLRDEERRKARLVAGMLRELGRHAGKPGPLVLVDAAAGKGYVGLAFAELVIPHRADARVVLIEREARRAEAIARAASRAETAASLEVRVGDVADVALWPAGTTHVAALHACGGATDAALSRGAAAGARHLVVCPCCVGRSVADEATARRHAERARVPRVPAVRRAFLEAFVWSLRTLRLEAAGYGTEVVPLAGPRESPYHLAFRARRVGEPVAMARAREALESLEAEA